MNILVHIIYHLQYLSHFPRVKTIFRALCRHSDLSMFYVTDDTVYSVGVFNYNVVMSNFFTEQFPSTPTFPFFF